MVGVDRPSIRPSIRPSDTSPSHIRPGSLNPSDARPGESSDQTMFFIALDGEDCILADSPTPLSSSLPKRMYLELQSRPTTRSLSSSPAAHHRRASIINDRKAKLSKRSDDARTKREQNDLIQADLRRAQESKLSGSLASAEEKRGELMQRAMVERERKERKRQESILMRRREEEKEQREHWTRMKQRQFVVQFRKERLKGIPRSKLLDVKLEDSTFLNEMAILIQSTWLRSKLRPVVTEFIETGILDVEGYENMQKVMMNRETIQAATNLVIRLVKCDPIVSSLISSSKAGRILLTGILLNRYGEEVMMEASEEELGLLEHASSLAEGLEAFLSHPNRLLMLQLADLWSIFRESFIIWQSRSKASLVDEMQRDYISLQEIASKLGPEAWTEWMPHVRRHQERLRVALKRVAGQASIDTLESQLKQLNIDKVSSPKEEKPIFEVTSELDEETRAQWDASIQGISGILQDTERVKIAHEMMVDPKFDHRKLVEMKTGLPYREAIKEFPDDLTMERFINFIVMVKGQLMEMVQGKGQLAQELQNHLEEEYLIGLCANKALEPNKLLQFITEIMGMMCAPMRDEQIDMLKEVIREGGDLKEQCKEVSRILLLMHEDLSNFSLNTVKPRVAQIIVSYERDWFAKYILNKPHPETTLLLMTVRDSLQGVYADRKPLDRINAYIAECFLAILQLGHDDLRDDFKRDSNELFILDNKRLTRMTHTFDDYILQNSLVLILRSRGHPSAEVSVQRSVCLFDDKSAVITEVCRDAIDVREAAENVLQGRDPIVALLRRRVGAILRRTLLMDNFSGMPVSIMIRNGFAEPFTETFNRAAEELYKAYQLHRKVLAPVYYGILEGNK